MDCLARSIFRSGLSLCVASTLAFGGLPAVASASGHGVLQIKDPSTTTAPTEDPPAPTVEPGPETSDPQPQPVPPPEDSMPPSSEPEPVAPPPDTPATGWQEPEPQTGPAPVPAPVTAPPSPPRSRRSGAGLGMLISGFSLFGATWLISAFIGAASIDISSNDEDDPYEAERKKDFGTRLMIPIGGPFAAAFVAPNATGALVSVLDGVAQVAGLTLGIVGSVMVARARARRNRMGVSFMPAPGGGYARFGMRF